MLRYSYNFFNSYQKSYNIYKGKYIDMFNTLGLDNIIKNNNSDKSTYIVVIDMDDNYEHYKVFDNMDIKIVNKINIDNYIIYSVMATKNISKLKQYKWCLKISDDN
jgi:hypothetical protein